MSTHDKRERAILRSDFLTMLDEIEATLKVPLPDGFQKRSCILALQVEHDGGGAWDSDCVWDIDQSDIDMLREALNASQSADRATNAAPQLSTATDSTGPSQEGLGQGDAAAAAPAFSESHIRPIPKDVLEKAIEFKGRGDDAGFLARAIIALESTPSSVADTKRTFEAWWADHRAEFQAIPMRDAMTTAKIAWNAALRSATSPSNALTRAQFDDILRKIVSRMGGHTFGANDYHYVAGVDDCLKLLALVKPEECGIQVLAEGAAQ